MQAFFQNAADAFGNVTHDIYYLFGRAIKSWAQRDALVNNVRRNSILRQCWRQCVVLEFAASDEKSNIPFAGKIDVFSLPGAHRLQFRDYPGGGNIPSNFEMYPRVQS